LPVVVLANWRGFSGGMRDMFDEVISSMHCMLLRVMYCRSSSSVHSSWTPSCR
jgi:acetyl-CoA carboxylase carboxyltransferase component